MTPPQIHLNGTSKSTLLEGYIEARQAVNDARTALEKVEFNPRDYYLIPGAWDAALIDRKKMCSALESVEKGLDEILMAIDEQPERGAPPR